jgi:hypothetical protein
MAANRLVSATSIYRQIADQLKLIFSATAWRCVLFLDTGRPVVAYLSNMLAKRRDATHICGLFLRIWRDHDYIDNFRLSDTALNSKGTVSKPWQGQVLRTSFLIWAGLRLGGLSFFPFLRPSVTHRLPWHGLVRVRNRL